MDKDPSSFSNPDQAVVDNYALDLHVDFSKHCLSGSVTLNVKVIDNAAQHLVLDTRDLCISSVSINDTSAQFDLKPPLQPFGSALFIALPSPSPHTITVSIVYKTSSTSSALQWLEPAQTLTKSHPYLFTQCQAIHARSMVPCQDTPAVKSTYSALIHVPQPLVALMSAVSIALPTTSDGLATYSFEQKVPIPSYLLALAVGLLEKRDIGPRTCVWAEHGIVDEAAKEFEDTEAFLVAAEAICGPYVWGRYDLLCLPPSFPYGGMENPVCTFVTPTLLAGDKSLANVVAHEIAHSWTGNLVTNRTWEHFWLNEGFTVYVERKILGRIYGDAEFHFRALIGWKHLKDAVEQFGPCNPLTNLCVKLDGVDPDDAFSSVPYEKGFNLLYYLETQFGRDRFEAFLRDWIAKHSFATVTSTMFVDAVKLEFGDLVDALAAVDWDAWLHQPGMPPVSPVFDTSLHEAVSTAAEQWLAQDHSASDWETWPASIALQSFSSSQKVAFLDQLLLHKQKLSVEIVVSLQHEEFGLANSGNSEIRFRYYSVAIAVELEAVLPPILAFLTQQGRMKFVRPLYRELFHSAFGRKAALDTFAAHRHTYHNIAAKMIERDLELSA